MRSYVMTALSAALFLAHPAWAERYLTHSGNIEVHCEAVPSMTLTPDVARSYNVQPDPHRGLLSVTVMKEAEPGKAEAVPAQVYAGAVNQSNFIMNVPLREVHEGKSVYYLGEFHIDPPDELRFLVNVNVLGQPLKAEFSRYFPKDRTPSARAE